MLSRFHLIPERLGRIDRRTNGQTDGQNCYISSTQKLRSISLVPTQLQPTRQNYYRTNHSRQDHSQTRVPPKGIGRYMADVMFTQTDTAKLQLNYNWSYSDYKVYHGLLCLQPSEL